MNKTRDSSLDITRIIAVLAVIMIHTSANFVISFKTSSIEFIWGNIFDSIARMGVPLFVMISGSLMLDENKDLQIKSLFLRNIKNIVLLLILWSAIYCSVYQVFLPLLNNESISYSKIIVSLINGHYHMWYLYMIIGLYLITPFLREFVKKENKRLVLLFITIALVSQFTLPLLNGLTLICGTFTHLTKFIEKFNLGFFGGFTAYYLVGWYIIHIGIKNKRKFYCLGIIALLALILYVQITKDYANAYSNMNILVFMYSTSVFLALNNKHKKELTVKNKKTIEYLSKLSFGAYIIHPLCQTLIEKVTAYSTAPLIYILCYFTIVTTLSFTVCFALSKLPIVKKAVRL